MEILPIKSQLLCADFDLQKKILDLTKRKLQSGDILVLTSKIVALAEGQLVNLKKIKPGKRAQKLEKFNFGTSNDPHVVELILQEADVVFIGTYATTVKNNILVPAAGVDLSNVPEGYAIKWPKNPQETAMQLWRSLQKKLKLKKLGIVIGDSHCKPLRWGTTGVALAWAGFEGVEDVRGQKDIYGKKLKLTRKAMADNLISSALIVMGEGNEKIPLVIIRNAPVKFTNLPQNPKSAFAKPRECILNGLYNSRVYAFSHRRPRLHPRHRPSSNHR